MLWSTGPKHWQPTRCWSNGCDGCVPVGRRRGRHDGWVSKSPEVSPAPPSVGVGFGALLDTVTSMNERVPDSTGLPLRAMVMVLLFLGVIFLLLGWQALGSSGSSDDDSASPVSSATSATSSASSTSPNAK